jgi:hypothetical protein
MRNGSMQKVCQTMNWHESKGDRKPWFFRLPIRRQLVPQSELGYGCRIVWLLCSCSDMTVPWVIGTLLWQLLTELTSQDTCTS